MRVCGGLGWARTRAASQHNGSGNYYIIEIEALANIKLCNRPEHVGRNMPRHLSVTACHRSD
jgi:hypothetical protein